MANFRTKALGAATAISIGVSGYVFSQRSILNLNEVHVDLQRVAECAIRKTEVDFVVVDGGRSEAEHKINVANGRSWTKRSRHQDGKAVDVAAFVDRKISYSPEPYYKIAEAFNTCSVYLNVPVVWGGTWKVKDLMHFELDRKAYP